MKYTKSALGLLNAQYRSVLKKCLLINLGLFALSAPAMAADIHSQVVVGLNDTWAPTENTTITGVSSDEGALTVKSGTIAANVAVTLSDNTSTSHGAALYYKDQNETSVSSAFNNNVTFSGNTSTASASSGGAVFVSGGNVSFLGDNNIFTGNKIEGTDVAGKLYKRGGGAIDNQSYENESSHSPIDSVMVIGKNTSTNTFSNNISSMNGGAIMNRAVDEDGNATLTINGNSTFSGNQATGKGGAIYNIQATGHTSTLNINGSALFENNTANGEANDIYNTGTLNLVATTINDSIVLNGGIDGDSANKGTTNISGDGYVKVANALKNQNVNNTGTLQLDGADLTGTTISGDGSIQIAGNSEIENTTLTDQAMEVETGKNLTLTDVILNKTAAGKGTLTNKAGGILKINGTSTTASQINVDVNNYGQLISDPTSYSGTVTNAAGAMASFDGDTFESTATLANNGQAYLENGVTFNTGADITGNGDLYLMSGTTHFNNTANANDVYLASGAKFDGKLSGGSLDTQNSAIDTGLGSVAANLSIDANLSGSGSADAFASTTGSTIKEITILGNDYNATKDELKIAIGDATLDSNVVINGANYYTSVTKDSSGNLVFSDKLINTSTIRGTDATGETVTIADKAETTNIGTTNAKISLSDSGKTATVTAANGLVISNGTPAQDATLKADANGLNSDKTILVGTNGTKLTDSSLVIDGGANDATLTATANGLNVDKGLTVATNKFTVDTSGNTVVGGNFTSLSGKTNLGHTEIASGKDFTFGGKTVNGIDGTTGTGNTTLATVATVTDKINKAAGNGLTGTSGVLAVGATDKSITVGADGIAVNVYANGGLETNSTNGLQIKAGDGVKVDASGLAVKAADKSVTVNSSGVAVNVYANGGLETNSTNGLQIKAGNGVEVGASGLAVKAEDSTITVGTGGIKVGTITDSNITDGTISQAKINGLTAALSAKADASDITVTAAQAAVTGSHLTAGTGVANNLASLDGALITVEGKVNMANASAAGATRYAAGAAVNTALAAVDSALNTAEGKITMANASAAGATRYAAGAAVNTALAAVDGALNTAETVNTTQSATLSTIAGIVNGGSVAADGTYTAGEALTAYDSATTLTGVVNKLETGKQEKLVVAADSGLKMTDGKTISVLAGAGLEVTSSGVGIKNLGITTDMLGSKVVTTEKIGDSAVDTLQLKNDAVTSDKIKDNAVITAKINNGAVTLAKIDPNAVDKTGASITAGTETVLATGAAVKAAAQNATYTKVASAVDLTANSTIAGALQTLDTNKASLAKDNTFTGFNTFKNDNGIKITNAAESGNAQLKIDTSAITGKTVLNIVAPTDGIYTTSTIKTADSLKVINADGTKEYFSVDNSGLTIGDGTNDKFTVDSATGNTTVGGTLGVTGDFAVNTNKFTVAAATGNTTVGGTLDVTGASTFTGAVTAKGDVTLGDAAADKITVNGTATFAEQIAATKGIAAGTNGTALTDNSLVLQGTGSNKATLTGTANGLNVAEGLTVNGDKFTVAADSGNTSVGGTLGVTGATTLGSTLAVAGDTTIGTKFSVTASNGNLTTSGISRLNGGILVNDKFKVTTTGNVTANSYKLGNDKFYVTSTGNVTGQNINAQGKLNVDGAATLHNSLTVEGVTKLSSTNGLQFGDAGQNVTSIDAGASALTTKDATALATVATVLKSAENADYTTTGANITAPTTIGTAINTLDTAIGDRTYTNDYNIADGQTVAASLNAIDTNMGSLTTLAHNAFGGTTNTVNITTALNALATNVATGMGGSFAADGKWSDTVVNTTSNGYTYTPTANIMDSLDQVAGNIGTKADIANKYNGVTDSQSVNKNLNAINGTIGDITTLSTDTGGSVGNALSNGTGVKPTTVVTALNNIDATLGKIHGLKATSDLGDKSNLASGTTVENHLVSLDNAIGDRSFTTTRYVAPNSDLATAVTALDSNLSRVEHKVNDLRHDFESGMASMAAMSALVPNPRSSGDTSLSIGTGAYGGHTAVAFGGFHYLTDNILLNAGASWGNTDDMAYRLGVTWSW